MYLDKFIVHFCLTISIKEFIFSHTSYQGDMKTLLFSILSLLNNLFPSETIQVISKIVDFQSCIRKGSFQLSRNNTECELSVINLPDLQYNKVSILFCSVNCMSFELHLVTGLVSPNLCYPVKVPT